jgi:uncharacterized phage-associated protein
MTTAIDVASYINARTPQWLDNRKLQKLVYFSHAWALGWTGMPLVEGDFEAWSDGPVQRDLWVCQRYAFVPPYANQLTQQQREVIDAVVDYYGEKSSTELVELSHESVWLDARGDLPPGASSRADLDHYKLRSYYVKQAIEGQGPKRKAVAAPLAEDDVRERAQHIAERWKAGLDLLATK